MPLLIQYVGMGAAIRDESVHGRQAWVLENQRIRVAALRGGGHLAEIRLVGGDSRRTINPLRVPHYPTIDPHRYDPARHDALYGDSSHRWLSAGYMGHLLCFPAFGPPSSDEEVRAMLGNHGEAPIAEWTPQGRQTRDGVAVLRYGAVLARTQYRVERVLRLQEGESVLRVEESVENLAPYDRPMNWVQHATFGPPFAEPGKMYLDVSAGQGQVGEGRADNSLEPGSAIRWPAGMARGGRAADLRVFQAAPRSGTYYAVLLDQRRATSYFTMYHSGYPLLVGYLFPTADHPWLGDWQENGSVTVKPWEGKAVARGIEFGTTPFPEGLRKSVERGRWLDTPTYRWIGGHQRLTTWWQVFLAEIPAGFAGVADLEVSGRAITVVERHSGRRIPVPISS